MVKHFFIQLSDERDIIITCYLFREEKNSCPNYPLDVLFQFSETLTKPSESSLRGLSGILVGCKPYFTLNPRLIMSWKQCGESLTGLFIKKKNYIH